MSKAKTNLQLLQELDLADRATKNPNFPVSYIPKKKFSDKDANSLTASIIRWLQVHGAHAERVTNMGVYRNGRYTKGQGFNGTSDVHACYKGRALYIEVKYGADRMSEAQYDFKDSVEAAGGVYVVAKTFDQFVEWWNSYIESL